MMFIDASALTAMLTGEEDARSFLQRIKMTSVRLTSPLAVWETAIAVARILALPIGEATAAPDRFLDLIKITVVPVAPEMAAIALDAFARYERAAIRRGSISAIASLTPVRGTSASRFCSKERTLPRRTSRSPNEA